MSTERYALLLCGLVLACSTGPTPAPHDAATVDSRACTRTDATVILGGGTGPTLAGYRSLEDGDTVYLTPGPQGGQHVWIGLRANGIDGTQPLIHLRAYRVRDDVLIGQLRIRLRLSPAPEDSARLALAAQTLIIDDDQYCSVLEGEIRVTLDFDDGFGACVNVSRRLRVGGIDPAALEVDRSARLNCCRSFLRRCFPNGVPADASVDAAPDVPG